MKKQPYKYILLLLVFFISAKNCPSQQKQIDSLKLLIKKTSQESKKIETILALSDFYIQISQFEEGIAMANEAYTLSKKHKLKKEMADAASSLGIANDYLGNYKNALVHYNTALKLYGESKNKRGIAATYNNMGIIYDFQGNYPIAMSYYLKALHLREQMKDSANIATSYQNIGSINVLLNKKKEAINYFETALRIHTRNKNVKGVADAHTGLGHAWFNSGNAAKGLEHTLRALELSRQIKDRAMESILCNNIGVMYENNNFENALSYYMQALKIRESIGDKPGLAVSYSSLGDMHLKQKHAAEAKIWLNKGLALNLVLGIKDGTVYNYQSLATADSLAGNYKEAFANYKMYIVYRDSLYSDENTRKITQAKMQFDFDKKQTQDSVSRLEVIRGRKVKRAQDKTLRFALYFGFGIVIIFALFMFNRFRTIKKQKRIIERKEQEALTKNYEITEQKLIIEEKQKELMDSIHYAKRIQDALLPGKKYIERILNK